MSAVWVVGFVLQNLRSILGQADTLDKRPAIEPPWVSLFFVKAFPGRTPHGQSKKRKFSTNPHNDHDDMGPTEGLSPSTLDLHLWEDIEDSDVVESLTLSIWGNLCEEWWDPTLCLFPCWHQDCN